MNRIRVACAGYKGALPSYWRHLDAFELSDDQSRAKRATHVRWRNGLPADARFVPRLPVELAMVDFRGPVAEAWWKRATEVAARLAADTVLLRTAPDFRPTQANRHALIDFFGSHRVEGLNVAWRAEGLWDGQPEDRDGVAEEAGLVPVVDPLGIDPDELDEALPGGDTFYWRLLGRPGGGTRFSESDLEELVALTEGRSGGYIVFGAGWMTGDARRLHTLLSLAPALGETGADADDAEIHPDDLVDSDEEG